jgi:leucyl aminopeptidase
MRLALAIALLAAAPIATAEAARPIAFAAEAPRQGALVLPLAGRADLATRGAMLDPAARAAIERALQAEEFDFKAKSTLMLRSIGPYSQVLIVGMGTEPLTASALQDIGGLAAQQTAKLNGPVTIVASGIAAPVANPAAQIALGAELGAYSFDRYKYVDPSKPRPQGREAALTIVGGASADQAYARDGRALAEAVRFTRDLANEPANVLHPRASSSGPGKPSRAFAGSRSTCSTFRRWSGLAWDRSSASARAPRAHRGC